MRVLGRVVDERFLAYRSRGTSIAGVLGGVVAMLLFAYRYYFDHVWSWDLLSVGLTIAVVKLAVTIWYMVTD